MNVRPDHGGAARPCVAQRVPAVEKGGGEAPPQAYFPNERTSSERGRTVNLNPFEYRPPAWANTPVPQDDPKNALERAHDLARSYYALGAQTGVHAMIEWCGVMGEHVKMLRYAYEKHGVEPDAVDQHSGTKVDAPAYMVEYLCEKLGCQLKPFIRGNPQVWRAEINKWFGE